MLHVVSFKNALCDVEISLFILRCISSNKPSASDGALGFLDHSAEQSEKCRTNNEALGMMRILHQVQGIVIF